MELPTFPTNPNVYAMDMSSYCKMPFILDYKSVYYFSILHVLLLVLWCFCSLETTHYDTQVKGPGFFTQTRIFSHKYLYVSCSLMTSDYYSTMQMVTLLPPYFYINYFLNDIRIFSHVNFECYKADKRCQWNPL